MYLLLVLLLGAAIGAVACVPYPQKGLREAAFSVALGVFGAYAGWQAGIAMGEDQISPIAMIFFSIVGSGAIVSVYHAVTSERPRLR